MENTTSSKHSSGTYWFHQHSDRSFSHQQERQHFWSFIHSSAAWWAWCPRCLNIWGKQGLLSLAGRPFCPHPGCQQSSATLHIDKSRDNPGCQERYSLGCPPQPLPPCEIHSSDLSFHRHPNLFSAADGLCCSTRMKKNSLACSAYVANSLQLHCWTLPWHRA